MTRQPRDFHSGSIYHITHRGHNRLYIFESDLDKAVFLDYLKKTLQQSSGNLLYYVLMDNHYHLLLEMISTPINLIMQRLNTSYGLHYAHAHRSSGALFGNRYTAEEVSEPDYFSTVIKYIALNPVKAGIVQKIGDYRWSAHLELAQKREGLVQAHRLYELLGKSADRGRAIYIDLVQNAQLSSASLPKQQDFRRKRKLKQLEDQLASYLIRYWPSISVEQVTSGSRAPELVKFRRKFAMWAFSKNYTPEEIAAVLKISSRSVRNWCTAVKKEKREK